jgi:glycogen(starch) synthase
MSMKILLIGPYPPPYGGISVHIIQAHRELFQAGIACRVLNTNRPSRENAAGSRARHWLKFAVRLLRHVRGGWILHLHTNGHNTKSWLLVLACGLAGRLGAALVLTLHSGMTPGYIEGLGRWRRRLARFTLSLYSQIVCVSPAIYESVASLGVRTVGLWVIPAYLKTDRQKAPLRSGMLSWIIRHQPLVSTTLFFRPEYGFDLLVRAVARLRERYRSIGCLVMGSGEQRAAAEGMLLEADLQDSVLLLGDVDHDTCLALMSSSDLFLRTTLEDGDSISVREALSLGVPVVASATGLRPRGTILFPPGDLEALLNKIETALRKPVVETGGAQDIQSLLEVYRHSTGARRLRAAA